MFITSCSRRDWENTIDAGSREAGLATKGWNGADFSGEEVLYWVPNGVDDQRSGKTLLSLIERLEGGGK